MPLYSKNLLQDTGNIDSSNLWIKENGVNYCYKTGEKFKGADVYRVSFDPTNNGRVFQLFDTKGIVSASLWVKYLQYDTTLVLTLREQNFGISAGLVSINQEIYDWQQIKLENAVVATDKPYMFALYKSGKTQVKEVIVEFAMTQLEKGSQATNFEPYELGMKKVRRIEKINEDMTGSASHAYPFGNVISVKEDVRLWNAKLKVYTTGTFNISVYEWKEWNGGRVGVPLFDKKMNITSLTDFTYSFDGLELKAGKKYWIGRLSTDPESTDSVGNAAVGRSTGMPASAFKYIDTLGGTSFRAQTVDFTSTWYYFYGLEVEAVNMKKAVGVPKSNLIEPFGDSDYYYRPGAESNFTVINGRRLELNATADHQYFRYPFPVKPNTVYTISAKHNGKIGVYTNDGASGIVDYTTNQKATFNSGARADVRVYWTNIGLGNGKFFIEDLVVQEGTDDTYKAYELVMKPASPVSKNLIKGFSSYIPNGVFVQQMLNEYKVIAKSTNPTTSNGYWLIDVKPFTNYTFSMERPANMDLGVFNVDATKVLAAYTTVGDVSFNSGANTQIRCYVKGANPDQVYLLNQPMLREFGDASFEPYTPTMKPAKLYTKKNFLTPFSEWTMDANANAVIEYMKDNSAVIIFASDAIYRGLRMVGDVTARFDELRGKVATLSSTYTLREGGAAQVQIRFSGGSSGITDFVLASSVGGPVEVTKYIPADFTSATVVIQTNTTNRNRMEVRDLQFEIGSKASTYSLFEKTPLKPF